MDTGEPSDGAPLVAIQQFLDYSDPQPAYRALLASGDVAQLAPGLAMAVSRDAVNEAAKHPDVFSSGGIYNLGNVRPLIPLAVDPPGHAKYRKILDPLFAPKRMDALEDDDRGAGESLHRRVRRSRASASTTMSSRFRFPRPSSSS